MGVSFGSFFDSGGGSVDKAFGVKMDTLMRMQAAYEIAQTRKREKLIRVPGSWRAA
jgi:hypothetical protein